MVRIMTVSELREELERFDDDMEICIGMEQNYGSNFAYTISETEIYDVKDWDNDREEKVVISMGRQFGTVKYE